MRLIFYGYSKCSTCRAAELFLKQHQIDYIGREITTTPPSIDELERMLQFQKGALKKLFNSSGILYRELQLSQKIPQMSVEEALALLSKNGMLVKRPFLLGPTIGLLGFREKEWLKLEA